MADREHMPDLWPEPFDLFAWLASQGGAASAPGSLTPGSIVPVNGSSNGLSNGSSPHPSASQTKRASHGHGHGHGSSPDPIERATLYLLSPGFPESIAGQNGHGTLYRAASELIDGFGLGRDDALSVLRQYNQAKGKPPEDEKQLIHKIDQAIKAHPVPSLNRLNADRGADDHARNGDGRPDVTGYIVDAPANHAEELPGFTHEFSDMGNALRLIDIHGPRIRYCKAYGDWLIYNDLRWTPDDHYRIESFAQEIPRQILAEIPPTTNDEAIKAYRKWALMSQSKDRLSSLIQTARSHVSIMPGDLDRNPWLFNVSNGTIDLKTGEFRPHDARDLITKLAPVEYDPSAECPTFDRTVLEIMKDDPDMVDYLRRAIGYSITGVIRQHVFFCCYGTGSNGKTLLFNILCAALGDYANEIDSEMLVAQTSAQHPTGLTELEGRRLIVAEETDDNRRLAEALIKRLTGGNAIKARKMHKDYYSFSPTHHLFLTTNHKPDIRGMDHGIWRRIKLVPFEVCFDFKIPGARTPDLELESKLLRELPGILNWILQGCRDWQERGLVEPEAIRSATQDYREEMDFLGWFLEERCKEDPDERSVLSVLYGDYVRWCDLANASPVGIRKFSAQLTDKGYQTAKSNSLVYKRGLRLKTDVERQIEMDHETERETAEVPF